MVYGVGISSQWASDVRGSLAALSPCTVIPANQSWLGCLHRPAEQTWSSPYVNKLQHPQDCFNVNFKWHFYTFTEASSLTKIPLYTIVLCDGTYLHVPKRRVITFSSKILHFTVHGSHIKPNLYSTLFLKEFPFITDSHLFGHGTKEEGMNLSMRRDKKMQDRLTFHKPASRNAWYH